MISSKKNHYEKALEAWLDEKKIKYISVDQTKRAAFRKVKLKSFDLLVTSKAGEILLTEIKGRKFKAENLKKTSAMQCWVTMDDIDGLDAWQQVFGPDFKAVFAFVYEFENPEVESQDEEIFEYDQRKYCFYIVCLEDYKKHMVLRSPKWKTVTMLTKDFKACATDICNVLPVKENNERQNACHS